MAERWPRGLREVRESFGRVSVGQEECSFSPPLVFLWCSFSVLMARKTICQYRRIIEAALLRFCSAVVPPSLIGRWYIVDKVASKRAESQTRLGYSEREQVRTQFKGVA